MVSKLSYVPWMIATAAVTALFFSDGKEKISEMFNAKPKPAAVVESVAKGVGSFENDFLKHLGQSFGEQSEGEKSETVSPLRKIGGAKKSENGDYGIILPEEQRGPQVAIKNSQLEKNVERFLLKRDLTGSFRFMETVEIDEDGVNIKISSPVIIRGLGGSLVKLEYPALSLSMECSYGAFAVYDYTLETGRSFPGEIIQIIFDSRNLKFPNSSGKKDILDWQDLEKIIFEKDDVLSFIFWENGFSRDAARYFVDVLSNYTKRLNGDVLLDSSSGLDRYTAAEFGDRLFFLKYKLEK